MKNQDLSRRLKLREGLIIAAVLIAAAVWLFLAGMPQSGGTAVITADNTVVKRLPLNNDTVYYLDDYNMEFTVLNGKIGVSHSECHDKVCVHTGYISGSFQSVVCLPNRVTVTIEADSGDIDVILQ